MPDVQVVAGISNGMQALVRLTGWITAILALGGVVCRLFKTDIGVTKESTLGDFVEADYGGYAPIAVSSFLGPYLDDSENAYAPTDVLDFVCDGSGTANDIYGAMLTADNGGTNATATASETGGLVDTPVITAGGDGYEAPPLVTITDATIGTGARAHAVLTGDAVSSIVIDDPGSGYTGPIVTIAAPASLVAAGNFGPITMESSTDACPVVFQLDEAV